MNLDDLNKALDESAAEETNLFLKQEGDMLAGKVLKIGEFQHADYESAPALTIETDDGSVVSDGVAIPQAGRGRALLLGTVLQRWFREEHIAVGDWIAVKHKGKKKSPSSGYSYNDFSYLHEAAANATGLEAAQSNF